MSIINDSHAIGVDTRNLVLKTRGSLHVKVGDRYYEIDFRNLSAKPESQEKEDYIIYIDSKDQINKLEYPGDNKLIIGLDGSIFVAKNNSFINVTPKPQTVSIETTVTSEELEKQITSLDSVVVNHMLYGLGSLLLDFINSEITTDVLTVNREINLPSNMIKNRCCKTTMDNDKYSNMDFIEIEEVPSKLVVKSGVMIKSNVTITLQVSIGNDAFENISFKEGGLYIIYLNDKQIIQTKLN